MPSFLVSPDHGATAKSNIEEMIITMTRGGDG